MAATGNPLSLIAEWDDISLDSAIAYARRIQQLCIKPPSFACIAKAYIELCKYDHTDDVEIAIRASELRGWGIDNIRLDSGCKPKPAIQSTSTGKSRTHERPKLRINFEKYSVPKQEPQQSQSHIRGQEFYLREIAKLHHLSIVNADVYVKKIKRLCVEAPSVSAIVAACKQLATERYSDSDIAKRASEIMGLSHRNVRAVDNTQGHPVQSRSLQSNKRSSVMGLKAIGREYGDSQKKGISDNGDWESD